MRVIAGEHRGRILLPPATDATRPVTDRVKQSVFDVLSPLIEGAIVYDCFAGTGSMGLECLSRGSREVHFFEADRSAIVRLKKNIAALRVENASKVIDGDLFRWFNTPPRATVAQADLVFLDPPYRFLTERTKDLVQWAARLKADYLRPGGTVIFRHDARDSLALPPLTAVDVRKYGSMTVEFLKPSGQPDSP
jgi:16S rRNA (guanine966-N2)-methyltransferase